MSTRRPLPVINGILTPISRVISPQAKAFFFGHVYGLPMSLHLQLDPGPTLYGLRPPEIHPLGRGWGPLGINLLALLSAKFLLMPHLLQYFFLFLIKDGKTVYRI